MIAKQIYSEKSRAAVWTTDQHSDIGSLLGMKPRCPCPIFYIDDAGWGTTLFVSKRYEETNLLPTASTIFDSSICLELNLPSNIYLVRI